MSHSQKTSYENIAENYLTGAETKPFINHYERPCMLKNIPPLKEKKVLDLGCASGFYSKYCLDNGAGVIAVDASPKMIKHTGRICENSPRLQTFLHDLSEPLDFITPGSVDIIIASLVLHYIENWTIPLKEFSRILKPGGTCLISTHHPMMDYTLFNQEDYFNKRLINDEWAGFPEPLKVRYFVRPLNEYIQPMLDSGMALKKLLEPQPDESLRGLDQKIFTRLCKKPAFLFFILERSIDEKQNCL